METKNKTFLKGFFSRFSWYSGIVSGILVSSIVVSAATLVNGLWQFNPGDTISASEVNQNFNLLRGNVVLDATNTAAISHQLSNTPQQCESGINDCVAGYVLFGNETAGTVQTRIDPTASTINSATATGSMSFVTIPADGFYEITLIADPSVYAISPPDEGWESTELNMNFAIIKFDSTDNTAGEVSSNGSAMKTPKIDGNEVSSQVQASSYFSRRDNDGNGTEDEYTKNIEPGVKEEVYLKAGDGLAVFYWIYFYNGYTPVGTDNVNFNAGSIRLKVKQIID